MTCCTSARSVKTANLAQPDSPMSEHSDRNREGAHVITASSNPMQSARSGHYEDELESAIDIEAAFLLVSPSLTQPISTKERLQKALIISGRHPSKRHIGLLWQEFSTEDGVDFKAFSQICREEKLPNRDDLLFAFENIDKSRTGYVSLHDLETILTTRGEKMSKEEFRKAVRLFSVNPDGNVRYADFCENVVHTSHECREVLRKNRVYRLRDPAPPVNVNLTRSSSSHNKLEQQPSVPHRSNSKDREVSEQQIALQQQLTKRHPDSLFCKLLDPAHTAKPKIPKLDTWHELNSKGYFILDDPSKGGFITSSYSLVVKRETRVFVSVHVSKSQRLSERLQKLDVGFYITQESSDGKSGHLHLSEFGFGEVHGICALPPGKYLLLPYTTGCILKDYDSAGKNKQAEQMAKGGQRPKSAGSNGVPPKLTVGQGKLSRELMDCIEDVFRMFDLDGDGFLSRAEFSRYYTNSEDESALDDVAWNAILDRSETEGQKLSFANFTKLFEMEVEEAEGDTEDLMIGLNNLGISRFLIIEEACGFNVQLLYESADADVRLLVGDELSSMFGPIRDATITEAMTEGVEVPSRRLADVGVSAYAFTDDRHVKVIVRNKNTSKTRIQLRIDASDSVACLFASASGSLRGKDGNSGGGARNVVTSTITPNSAVPLLFAVPTHPERMAEFVISSIDIIQP